MVRCPRLAEDSEEAIYEASARGCGSRLALEQTERGNIKGMQQNLYFCFCIYNFVYLCLSVLGCVHVSARSPGTGVTDARMDAASRVAFPAPGRTLLTCADSEFEEISI